MAKGSPVTKLVNGEIADADVVNQIAEDIGSQGGLIPYDPNTNDQDTIGGQSVGSTAFPWGSIFLNRNANFVEVDPSTNTAASSVAMNLLRKFITLKDSPGNGVGTYTGQGGRFVQVNNAETGLQFSIPSNIQIFKSSGTFVCPAGITTVYISMVGGGSGGCGSGVSHAPGGAGGGFLLNHPFTVIPGNSYTVTIGGGGNASNSGNSSPGGTTSFDALNAPGGNAATGSSAVTGAAGGGGLNASNASVGTFCEQGGSGGNDAGTGGAGGSTPFGVGGAIGTSAAANTGAGGGGASSGGNGGSGICIVAF